MAISTLTRPSIGNARITIAGCLAVVDPGHGQLLAPLLAYSELVFEASGGQVPHHRHRRHVCEQLDDGRLVIPVGCVGRVMQLLAQGGMDVTLDDRRRLDRESLHIDAGYVHKAEQAFPGLADAIRSCTEGLLGANCGRARERLLGTLCRLLPRARILVASATVAKCRELADALEPYVPGEVDAVRGGDWRSLARVVCGTFTSFDTSDQADWDVLIFEDAVEALGKKTHENRGRYGNHLVYAFVDPQNQLSLKDELKLETFVGPVIYRVPSRSRRSPPVMEIVFAGMPLYFSDLPRDPREQKQTLWRDEQRNAVIARIADAFARRDPVPLWEAGLFLHEDDPFARWGRTPTVAIVVESVQHAEQLAQALPDWTVLHSRPTAGGAAAAQGWADWVLPPRTIATITRAAGMKIFAADVVIMATGGAYPQLPHGLLRHRSPVLIVDFADDGHRSLVSDVEKRRKAYRDLGCVTS
jgi:hypothetical protein